MTRASSSGDIGYDVVMRRGRRRKQSGTPEFVGVRQQEKNHDGRGKHVKPEMRKRPSPSNTFQEKKSLGEDNAVGAPSCGGHTRGTGRIPPENNESCERREQYIELGVKFHQQEYST